jgi:hypothetical protein
MLTGNHHAIITRVCHHRCQAKTDDAGQAQICFLPASLNKVQARRNREKPSKTDLCRSTKMTKRISMVVPME